MASLDLTVAVVGAGEIGLGMAAVLADAGATVCVAEPSAPVRDAAAGRLRDYQVEMEQAGLDRRGNGDIRLVPSVGGLPTSVDLAIEAGPEDLAVKRAVFRDLRDRLGPRTPIASTSSAITVSQILSEPSARRHCLVAHPANPPTLIRVVECVPAPETDPEMVAQVIAWLEAAGFAPVPLGREVEGFALNRLQSALLREAYRLVEAGVVDVAGADRLVADGLGPRWALSGPFETADLNTPGGIAAHVRRMGPAYARIGQENGERGLPWSDDLVATVVAERRAILPEESLPARVRWRRQALARLLRTRRDALALWRGGAAKDG